MADYEVGFGKPPKKSQWKKGQSGNPKGSKKKPPPQPLLAEMADYLSEPIELSGTGEKISMAKGLVMQIYRQAMTAPLATKLQFLAFMIKHGVLFEHQNKLMQALCEEEPEEELTEEEKRLLEITRHIYMSGDDGEDKVQW